MVSLAKEQPYFLRKKKGVLKMTLEIYIALTGLMITVFALGLKIGIMLGKAKCSDKPSHIIHVIPKVKKKSAIRITSKSFK